MPLNALGSKRRSGYGLAGIRQSSKKKRMRGKGEKRKRSAHDRKKQSITKPLHVSLRRTALNKRPPWPRRKFQCLVAGLKVCDTSISLLSVII
jgi:hypothetical protein